MKLQIFYDKQIPKLNSNHTFLAVISLDFALKKDDNYHPQVILKDCKCIEKKVDISMIILVIFLLLMSLMKNNYPVNVF